jgi:ribonuclease G
MYNADDAVARVDSYIVSVTGGGGHLGERRLVRIERVGRSAATASLVDESNGAEAKMDEEAEQLESPARRRRGRRGGRRRSRASAATEKTDDS